MSEIRPQFTYSPEGVLTVTVCLSAAYRLNTEQELDIIRDKQEHLEFLGEDPGVTIQEADGVTSVAVEIAEKFRRKFTPSHEDEVDEFLYHLGHVLPFHPQDPVDRLVNLDYLHAGGAGANVNLHFQSWLNSSEGFEEALMHSAVSMAIPFGRDDVRRARREFRVSKRGDSVAAEAWTSSIAIQASEFGLQLTAEQSDEHLEMQGKTIWRQVTLSTLGNCACWGVSGQDRERVRVTPESVRLYEMHPHNVDIARQSLSLLMGMGALTYHAAMYDSREGIDDVLARVHWSEPRFYPKISETSAKTTE